MKIWKRLLMAVCLCAIWSFTALAAESDPVKIERVKLKFESFRPKDGYVKITNLGTGYSVGDSDFYRYESSDYDDKEVIWFCVDMAPLNRSIGVPLDPVWTADGTAKWTVAYKAESGTGLTKVDI